MFVIFVIGEFSIVYIVCYYFECDVGVVLYVVNGFVCGIWVLFCKEYVDYIVDYNEV